MEQEEVKSSPIQFYLEGTPSRCRRSDQSAEQEGGFLQNAGDPQDEIVATKKSNNAISIEITRKSIITVKCSTC
jgi:hypothetical protein